MEVKQIRQFRRDLRMFERITNLQLKNCCHGVTLGQCSVLLEIDEHGRSTMGSLSSGLRLDNSTLTRTTEGLVHLGLVKRVRDEGDRRVVWVELTAQGKATCRSIHNESDACCQSMFDSIPASKRVAVAKNFGILVKAFADHEDESERVACAADGRG